MAISFGKNRQLVFSEAKRDVEEDERLTISCFKMSVGQEIVTKLANPVDQVEEIEMFGGHKTVTELANPSDQVVKRDMSVGYKKVTQLANPTDQVEKSLEFKLCHIGQAKNSSVMYDEMYAEMYAKRFDEICSTVFNMEPKTEYNIGETAYSQQYHTNAMEQCRDVNEQVGITMTHLAYCWDGGKQMLFVVYMVRDQGDRPKEMQNMFAGARGQGMLDEATQRDQIKTSQFSTNCLVFVIYVGYDRCDGPDISP
jgi:hypothetical protein